MKALNIFIFLLLFYSLHSIIPNWDLSKSAKDLLSSSNYTEYVIYHEIKGDIDLKMIKKIIRSEGNVTSSNYIIINGNKPKKVPFDNIESFYNLNILFKGIIICPIGKYHPYNLTGESFFDPPPSFPNEGTWDLKCVYHKDSNFFIQSYAEKNRYNFYYTNDKTIEWYYFSLKDGFYDYKIKETKPEGSQAGYSMINFINMDEKLFFSRNHLDLNKKDEYIYQFVFANEISEYFSTTKGFFKKNSTNFYFITYDNTKNFLSGYTNSTCDDFNIRKVGFNLNSTSPFEFEEDLEIEEINFILKNKFIYYKLKDPVNNNTYHGIIDLELNRIIFNTNETITSFIPYSDMAMLAITPNTAYRICAYNDEDNCTDDCPEGYIIDPNGNRCDNSTFCPYGQYILIPGGDCVDSCDTTFNIIKDRKCGPCEYFYSDRKYKFVNGTKCLNSPPNNSEAYDVELNILKCKDGYKLVDDIYCEKDIKCYNICETCEEEPISESQQNCLTCKEGYLFEDGNCLINCSKGYQEVEKKCLDCKNTICNNFITNSCDCLQCKDKYYLKEKKCYECALECETCFNNSKNCTSCSGESFLYNGTCLECPENCKNTDSGSCKCLSCYDKYFLDDYQCKKCDDICNTCNNSDTCNSCLSGYVLENNKCVKCNSNCEECFAPSSNNGEQNCISCKDITKVLYKNNCINECPNNFYKDKNNQCKECTNLCKTYNNICNNCTSCHDGYYLKENSFECLKCNEHCETCKRGEESNNEQCSSCNISSEYKYLIEAEGFGRNCVKECPSKTILKENKCILDEEEDNNLLIIIIPSIIVGLIIIIIIIFIFYRRYKIRRTEEPVDSTEVVELSKSFDL